MTGTTERGAQRTRTVRRVGGQHSATTVEDGVGVTRMAVDLVSAAASLGDRTSGNVESTEDPIIARANVC